MHPNVMADSINFNDGNGHKLPTTRRYEATDSAADGDLDTLQDRRKRLRGKSKAKTGKLAALMDVPLDVIFEASPSSTLHLTQTFLYNTDKFDLPENILPDTRSSPSP